MRQFPHAPRCYAEALLDTIDFLCESRQPLPPVACGLGQAHFIRHRLTKIMRGASPKAMSQRVRLAMFLSAALLLPMQPFVFGSANKAPMTLTADPPELPLIVSSSIESLPSHVLDETRSDSQSSGDLTTSNPANVSSSATTATTKSSHSQSRALRGKKVWSTAVSQDGRFVVRATTGRRVLLSDLSLNTESDLSSHGITAVSFTPDAKQFVAVANDGRVMLWDAMAGELNRVLQTHDSGLRSVSVSPRGDAVVVGGHDGTLLVLDLNTGESLVPLSRQSLPVNCVRFSPDGSRLAVALGEWSSNRRGQVKLIDLQTAATTILKCDSAPGAITFASNDELIVGQWNGRANLWNLIQRQVVGAAMADKNIIAAASFSPDNPQLREIGFVSPVFDRE